MNVKTIYRLVLVVVVLTCCAGCDQATKKIAKSSLASAPPISLLNDSVRIEYTENSGAFLGLGSSWPNQVRFLFFVVFVIVTLTMTLVFTIKTHGLGLMHLIGLSLVTGGGIGNLLDRLFNDGIVIDFIRLGIGPLRTGIFNVADVAIMGGMAVVMLFSARGQVKAVDEA
jgi:signal peptidase II